MDIHDKAQQFREMIRTALQEASNDGLMKARGGFTFRQLQERHRVWALRNFGEHPSYWPLLGATEELGELAHAHLKAEQGIRGTAEEHRAAKRDAIADCIIFLADYCSCEGFDLEELMVETWEKVEKRDWVKDKQNGGT